MPGPRGAALLDADGGGILLIPWANEFIPSGGGSGIFPRVRWPPGWP